MTDNPTNTTPQPPLFAQSDVDTVPLVDYVRWFIDRNHPRHDFTQLPPIQRGTVWKVAQIERLWDSLLRGFPIGSFLLAQRPRDKETAARSIQSHEQIASKRDGWFLLDGQQRTRALLLGFRASDSARLWIDLAPPPIFFNADHNDRMFLFRLLTTAQPWGTEWNDPDAKLSESIKYEPRKNLLGKTHYDYEVKLDLRPFDHHGSWCLDAKTAWPLRAELPVPFDALVALCGGYSGCFVRPKWEAVERLAHPQSQGIGKQKDNVHAHLDSLLDALEAVVHGRNTRRRTVVTLLRLDPQDDPFLQRQTASDAVPVEHMQDAIEVLFRRANSGGTPLAGEEMVYSLLKARWDEAYPLVDQVVQDKQVGYLLSPSSLVLAAARLALLASPGRRDVAQPSVRDFRRWIGERDGAFLAEMRSLLQPVAESRNAPARFHAALARLCELVLYRDAACECAPLDVGLPRKLLLSVPALMLHPVLYWLDQRRHDARAALEKSRLPLVRYLVFSLLGVLEVTKASLYAVEVLREQDYTAFPDREIYQRWCAPGKDQNSRDRDPVVLTLPTPDHLAVSFATPVDGLLRDWTVLFGGDDAHREFRRRFWAEGPHWRHRDLLLWFQRQYLPLWFKEYNPMREDGADTPYDADHILANAHLIKQGATPWGTDLDAATLKVFKDRRWFYLNSLGNFRIWPLWANRSDGKKAPACKLRLDPTGSVQDPHTAELGLHGGDDFLIASSIDPANRCLWLDASDEPLKWPKVRREAWQSAVEGRTMWLYRTLYNALGYSAWQ